MHDGAEERLKENVSLELSLCHVKVSLSLGLGRESLRVGGSLSVRGSLTADLRNNKFYKIDFIHRKIG